MGSEIKIYRTSDLDLTCVLITTSFDLVGISYRDLQRPGKELPGGRTQSCKVLFEFECTEELNQAIIDYMGHRLRVDANLLLANLRGLKSLISNANFLTPEEVRKEIKK